MAEHDHISPAPHHQIATALKEYLADTAVVYFKTHGFHWNIEGENFYGLHLMLEKFYEELWESLDEIAERIRALGEKTPSSLTELLRIATFTEIEAAPANNIMVKVLHQDYSHLAKKAYEVGSIADAQGDRVTTDMMTAKATFLEKAAWMLQSTATD